MTLKIRTRLATEQINRRMVILMAGFHLCTEEDSLNIRGFDSINRYGTIQGLYKKERRSERLEKANMAH